ncbi:MAG: hypothetical protein GQE15_20430 [Archangiaceae bacterium]|nr:hypothetical protein [Archangiaceae bacterium]
MARPQRNRRAARSTLGWGHGTVRAMYFSRLNTRTRWTELKPLEQRCVAQLFMACGGFEEWSSFEEWLGSRDVASANVLDDGVPVAHWFQFSDTGLLFDARTRKKASDLIIGSATQHGFICEDKALWKALEAAENAPPGFDWKVKRSGGVMRPEGTAEANWQALQNQLDGVSADPGDPTLRYEPGAVKLWVDGAWEPATITGISYTVARSGGGAPLVVTAGRLAPAAKGKAASRKK